MKLTKKQTEIFNILVPALVGQKLPLESETYTEEGKSVFKANRAITKKAVQQFVASQWPDGEENEPVAGRKIED